MEVFRRGFAIFIILRASYAVAIYITVVLYRLGIANPIGISGHFADLAVTVPMSFFVLWTLYVAGYFVTGWLVLARRSIALWIYAAAMAVDFTLWIQSTLNPHYEMIWSGVGAMIDVVLNVIDLSILTGLILLVRFRHLR